MLDDSLLLIKLIIYLFKATFDLLKFDILSKYNGSISCVKMDYFAVSMIAFNFSSARGLYYSRTVALIIPVPSTCPVKLLSTLVAV